MLLTASECSHYIARARQYRPTVPADVSNYVVDSYVRLRKRSKDDDAQAKSHTYTSARTLLGVLRLSQALARLRFSDLVQRADVDEALRLMDVSKKSLADEDEDAPEHDRSDVSKIFRLIKDMAKQAQSGKKGRRARGGRRFGRGPGGERDMDVDEDEDDENEEIDVAAAAYAAYLARRERERRARRSSRRDGGGSSSAAGTSSRTN